MNEYKLQRLCADYFDTVYELSGVEGWAAPHIEKALSHKLDELQREIEEEARLPRYRLSDVLLSLRYPHFDEATGHYSVYTTADAFYAMVVSAIKEERVLKKLSMRHKYGSPFTKGRQHV